MKNNLVSIIVPVYNAEKTLKKCCYSLLEQTYKNIEIILVNDGSNDDSSKICRKFAKKDHRVKFIDKENGGVSSARNAGIECARGEYLSFVDSDDYVDKEYIQNMYEKIQKDNSDICLAGYWIKKHGFVQKNENGKGSCLYDQSLYYEKLLDFIWGKNGMYFPVAKLYRKSLIKQNEIKFNENIQCGEDMLFNVQFFRYCKSMTIISECNYYYIMHGGGLSGKYQPRFWRDMSMVYQNYLKIYEENYPEKITEAKEIILTLLRNTMFNFYYKKRSIKEGTVFLKKCSNNSEVAEILQEVMPQNRFNQIILFCIKHGLYSDLCIGFKAKNPIKKYFFPIFCFVRKYI